MKTSRPGRARWLLAVPLGVLLLWGCQSAEDPDRRCRSVGAGQEMSLVAAVEGRGGGRGGSGGGSGSGSAPRPAPRPDGPSVDLRKPKPAPTSKPPRKKPGGLVLVPGGARPAPTESPSPSGSTSPCK